MEWNRRQFFEPAKLACVDVRSEQDPAGQRRRHNRRRRHLPRVPADRHYAGILTVVECVPKPCDFALKRRVGDAADSPVGAHHRRQIGVEPVLEVGQRRGGRRTVTSRRGFTKTEVVRQELSRVLHLLRALLPQSVIDSAACDQLALDLHPRDLVERNAEQRRDRQQHRRE